MTPKLILASRSPRRREILSAAGFSFEIRVPTAEELRLPGEPPADYVCRLAREKASAVPIEPDEVILAADTVVVAGEQVLEKPCDGDDARRMLELLSGREHQVLTGVCLRTSASRVSEVETTRVWFAPLHSEEIAAYVVSGEPHDKAGAYAIQGLASKFIYRIEGCYFNVVGLPISRVYRMLKQLEG